MKKSFKGAKNYDKKLIKKTKNCQNYFEDQKL